MNRVPSVIRISLLLLLAGLMFSLPLIDVSSVYAEDKQVKIGVLAKRGAKHCLQKWSATAEYLSQNISGYSFSIVPLSFDQVNTATQKGEIDFVLTNSSYYVTLEINHKVDRLVTLINRDVHNKPMTTFAGVIITRADRHDLTSVKDFVGKRFVAVDPKSLGGWLAVLREFKQAGINPRKDFAKLSFAGTHDAAVYVVRDGKADAGCVRTSTLERMAEEGKINLTNFKVIHGPSSPDHILHEHHLLHSTGSYPEWPLARLKHVDDTLAMQVAGTLIDMPSDSHAAQRSHSFGWSVPLNYQSVHEGLRELRIGPYRDYGKFSIFDVFRQYWSYILGAAIILLLFFFLFIRLKNLNINLEETVTKRDFELDLRQKIEKRLNETQRIALLGSWEWDIIDNSLWWSEETYRIFGFQPADKTAIDKFIGVIHPDDRQKVNDLIEEAVTQGIPLEYEYRIELPNGELRFIYSKSQPIYDDTKRIIKRAGSVQDVTKQKKAEIERERLISELQESSDKIKLFAYSVSHDLKNPAVALHGITKLFIKKYRDTLDEKGTLYCDRIKKISDHIISLVEQINLYMSTKEQPIVPKLINAKKIFQTIRQEYSNQLNKRGIKWLESELDIEIRADRMALLRVFRNFIDNALKYGGDALSTIEISYNESDEAHIFSVKDDGVGLDPDDCKKIFDPFKRSKTVSEVEGCGLGLAIVKEIAELHDGKVWGESDGKNGITFYFTIAKKL